MRPANCRIRGSFQSLRQHGMTDQPDRHQVARVESEVEEGWEVAEEVGRRMGSEVFGHVYASYPKLNAGVHA